MKLRQRTPRARARQSVAAKPHSFVARSWFVVAVLALAASGLVWRAVDLQLRDHEFLAGQGDARFQRVVDVTASRGTVTDRHGEPLAVSTPVDSVWVNPKELALASDQLPRLAKALKRDKTELTRRITSNLEREFLYVARHLQPADAAKIKALGIPGVNLM
ncbi:MAG TPA: penicillin-binding protein 2, partial [Steroidobacteraceae bacterium]|nr:penicillin-binding protein 2 [Steroidobacteraceae bacterium]